MLNLTDDMRGDDAPPSQAFFNIPQANQNGLSRSVSCLSSRGRPMFKVEHPPLPLKSRTQSQPAANARNMEDGFTLSRSKSCHAGNRIEMTSEFDIQAPPHQHWSNSPPLLPEKSEWPEDQIGYPG